MNFKATGTIYMEVMRKRNTGNVAQNATPGEACIIKFNPFLNAPHHHFISSIALLTYFPYLTNRVMP